MSIILKTCSDCNLMRSVDQKLGNYLKWPNVSSTGNCRHPKTLDVWYISAMNKSFDLKVWVLKHLPLSYIHTIMTKATALQGVDLN